ncbi:MAG: hypothetical protein Q4E24_07460 [bacterium]|nr:hypothetical protein [bacterium]
MDFRFGSGDFSRVEETKRYEKTDKTAVYSARGHNVRDTYWTDGCQSTVRGYVEYRTREVSDYGLFGDYGGYRVEKKYTGRNIETAAVFYTPSKNDRNVMEIGKQVLTAALRWSCQGPSTRLVMNDRDCKAFLDQMLQWFVNTCRKKIEDSMGMAAVIRLPVEGDFYEGDSYPDNFGIFWAGTARIYMLSSAAGLQLLTEDTDLFPARGDICMHSRTLKAHEVAEDSFLFTVTENVYSLFSSPLEFEKFLLKHLLATQKTECCEQLQEWADAIGRGLKSKFGETTDFSAAFLKTKTAAAKGQLQAYEERYQKLYRANEEAEILAEKILNIYRNNGRASRRAVFRLQDLFQRYQKKDEELQQFEKSKTKYSNGFMAVLKKGMRECKSIDAGTETLDLEEWENHVRVLKEEQETYKKAVASMDVEQMQQSYETVIQLFEQQKKLTDAMEDWNYTSPEKKMEGFVQILVGTPEKLEEITNDWNLAVENWKTFKRNCKVKEEELQRLYRELKNCLVEEVQNEHENFLEAFFESGELTEKEASELIRYRQKMLNRQKVYESEYLIKYKKFLERK